MALSEAAPRQRLHTRRIVMEGFERADGLFDIEAHLEDTKDYAFSNQDRGEIPVGEPLHGMRARMTVDTDFLIHAFEADTEFSPYAICPQAAPNFARLAGLRIGPGFVRAANERVGGVHGCTHIREMLGQMGTVAFQTLFAIRMRRRAVEVDAEPVAGRRPAILGTCLAYAPSSPVVARDFPRYHEPELRAGSQALEHRDAAGEGG